MADATRSLHRPAPPRPQGEVPAAPADRARVARLAADHVRGRALVPPLAIEELREQARDLRRRAALPEAWEDYLLVALSNALWRDTVAAIPHERRVVLLPMCLRDPARCPAATDAYGVLCQQCGRCPIGALQAEAERLGSVVLVAEGTTVVTRLIESGRVDAVIGVSCLAVLERAFPYLAADAVPGLAVPLLHDGCLRTAVDAGEVLAALRTRSAGGPRDRADLERLREEVAAWFDAASLGAEIAPGGSPVERLALDWMLRGGKRWRPFLAAAVHQTLRPGPAPDALRRIALAVECFHKASLVHDDIEDDDAERYGRPTLHRDHGVAVALNAGDFLLGQGYRLLADCGLEPPVTAALLAVAAEGHRTLCLGQGAELDWMRRPTPLAPAEVIEIFRRKTAPAFEVALRLGAIAGGETEPVAGVLRRMSDALGIAYQIRDDLEDFRAGTRLGDLAARRPSLLTALAHAQAPEDWRERIRLVWTDPAAPEGLRDEVARWVARNGVEARAAQLLAHYRLEAVRSLATLRHGELKALLHRLLGRILGP